MVQMGMIVLIWRRLRGLLTAGVAPGPIWTPLIPSTMDESMVEGFGTKTPMGRMGQPSEIAPSYVFLASEDSSYIAGQVLHPNGEKKRAGADAMAVFFLRHILITSLSLLQVGSLLAVNTRGVLSAVGCT